jgi:putative ABC transport system permease protein
MTPTEAIGSALGNLSAHKLRSALTMLGMIFGVGAVIAMLSIGAGAERQALGMIEQLGLHNVIVRSLDLEAQALREVRKKSLGVSPRDAAAISEGVPGVEMVAPRVRLQPYKVFSPAGKSDDAEVHGVSHRHAELARLELAEGRFFDAQDEAGHAQVAILGAAVRRDLFGFGPALGDLVKVDDVWLRVIGVLASGVGEGASIEGVAVGSTDQAVLVPVSTAVRKFEREALEAPFDEIVVKLAADTDSNLASRAIEGLVDRLHAGARDYQLVVPGALLAQSRRTQRLFNLVMGAIAGISLLVGGIGIMNIMLATVLERTREIGVRRALGARQKDIRFQFMIESFTLSAVGGLIGIVVGVGIAWSVAAWAGWATEVTLWAIVLSTGVAVAVGLVSGIYPAVRAARLDPIEALRYE